MNTANVEKIDPSLLKTKRHFDILDGLRGVAALAVVLFHFMEIAISSYTNNPIAHTYLAVDFFFCLSGFVIGYAYDNRIEKMGVAEFFKSRLIRLHPLVIFCSVLGLLTFLFDPFGGNPEQYSASRVCLIFLCSILLIPFPTMRERYFTPFSFIAPAWSLFWEYIANIFYAFILCRISVRYLRILILISAVALCCVSYRSGNLAGGWAAKNFWDGSARIAYSFSAGLLVYRSNWIVKTKLGFIGLSALLFLSFLIPFSKQWNWYADPIVVLFYFPLLVALGAGATLTERFERLCVFLGKISYPLYMIHYAVIWMFIHYYKSHKPTTPQVVLIITIAMILLLVFTYLVTVLFDNPVRKYLTNKRKQKSLQPIRHEQNEIV